MKHKGVIVRWGLLSIIFERYGPFLKAGLIFGAVQVLSVVTTTSIGNSAQLIGA